MPTRMAVVVPTTETSPMGVPRHRWAYQRHSRNESPKREVIVHQIQKTLIERTRFAAIFDYFWPSGWGRASRKLR